MRKVGSRELKNRLGRYLALVSRGESIVVTDRGTPVARLEPLTNSGEKPMTWEEKLQELEAQGLIRLARDRSDRSSFKPIRTKGKRASRMIIEDRR